MIHELLLVVFILTQVVYAVVNLLGLLTIYPYRTRLTTKSEPDEYEDLHVLLPLRGESRDVIEGTLESIQAAEYPKDLTHVYAIYESDDEVVSEYVNDASLADAFDIDLITVPVETDDRLWQQIADSPTARTPLGKRKGRALTYALYRLNVDGVVTVLDADTEFEPDLFRRGVAGLDEYGITQAKQTVRNIDDGLLPLWESMGIAAWSHAVYAKTARGPYQLLGKGYFLRTETLYDLRGWNPTDPTEDMALGMEAYKRGYTLGIIDSYVQDLCPSGFWAWVRQKRRWVGGPYRALRGSTLSTRDALRFGSFTMVNQLVSINHVFGIPAGVAMLYLGLTGSVATGGPIVTAVLAFNLVMWAYFTVKMYAATRQAVQFRSRGQKIKYYVLSNPITQVVYALLWVIPIGLYLFGSRTRRDEFVVTPKQVRRRVESIRVRGAADGSSPDDPATERKTGSGAVFEVYRDRGSEWRWRLVHGNTNIIADSGEGYERKAGAVNGLESVRRTAATAQVLDLDSGDERAAPVVGSDGAGFEIYRDRASEWRWRLVHHNGNITADSGEGYKRRAGVENGIDSVHTNAPDAVVVELPRSDPLLPGSEPGSREAVAADLADAGSAREE